MGNVCNIGLRDRAGRLMFGLFFFTIAVWTWAFFIVNKLPHIWMFYLFIPFYLGFLGITEAVMGFCVFHYSIHEQGRKNKKRDRKQAKMIHAIAIIMGTIFTVIFYVM